MPVFVPAFEERRQGRRRCSLKGRSTAVLAVAVELHPLDAAIGNHAAVESAPGNAAAIHKRALFNGVDADVDWAGVRGEPDVHRTAGGRDVLIRSHGNEESAGAGTRRCYAVRLPRHPLFTAYLALGAVCFFWGTTFLGIRMSLESFPPLMLVSVRYMISGAILLLFAWARGIYVPRGRELAAACFSGLFTLGVGRSEERRVGKECR